MQMDDGCRWAIECPSAICSDVWRKSAEYSLDVLLILIKNPESPADLAITTEKPPLLRRLLGTALDIPASTANDGVMPMPAARVPRLEPIAL